MKGTVFCLETVGLPSIKSMSTFHESPYFTERLILLNIEHPHLFLPPTPVCMHLMNGGVDERRIGMLVGGMKIYGIICNL